MTFKSKGKDEFGNEEAVAILQNALAIGNSKLFAATGNDSLSSKDGTFRKLLRCNGHQYDAQQFISYLKIINDSFDAVKGEVSKERNTALANAIKYYLGAHEAINQQLDFGDFVKLVRTFEFLHRNVKDQKDIGNALSQGIGKSLKRTTSYIHSNIDKFDLAGISHKVAHELMSALVYPLNDKTEKLSLNTQHEAARAFFKFASKLAQDEGFINNLKYEAEVWDIRNRLATFNLYSHKDKSPVFDDNKLPLWGSQLEERAKVISNEKKKEKEKADIEWELKRKALQDKEEQRRGIYALRIPNLASDRSTAEEIERERKERRKRIDLLREEAEFAKGEIVAIVPTADGDIRLSLASKRSLEPKEWLDGDIIKLEYSKIREGNDDPHIFYGNVDDIEFYVGWESGKYAEWVGAPTTEENIASSSKGKLLEEDDDVPAKEKTEVDKRQERRQAEHTSAQEGKEADRKAIAGKDILVFPMNVSSNHWVVVFIDLRKPNKPEINFFSTMSDYKSVSHAKTKLAMNWLGIKAPDASFGAFRKMLRLKKTSVSTEIPFTEQPISKQSDGYNCGVYVTFIIRRFRELAKDPNFKFSELAKLEINEEAANRRRLEIKDEIRPFEEKYKNEHGMTYTNKISPLNREKIARSVSSKDGISVRRNQISSTPLTRGVKTWVSCVDPQVEKIYCHPEYIVPINGGRQFQYIGEMADSRSEEGHPLIIDDLPTFCIPMRDKQRGADSDLDHVVVGDNLLVTMKEDNGREGTVSAQVVFPRRVRAGDSINRPLQGVRTDTQGREFIRFHLVLTNQEAASRSDIPTVDVYKEDIKKFFKHKNKAWKELVAVAEKPINAREPRDNVVATLMGQKDRVHDDNDLLRGPKPQTSMRRTRSFSR